MASSVPLTIQVPGRPAMNGNGAVDNNMGEVTNESFRNEHGAREQLRSESPQTSIPEPPAVYEDPFLAARDALWFHTGINDLVRIALEKMVRAFAYNSVFFLKAVMDLQVQYLVLDSPPPPAAILDVQYVIHIAEILSVRMARRAEGSSSLSRELQLRTLVSALHLLGRHRGLKLDNDAYAGLLKHISERDYDNHVKYNMEGRTVPLGSGDSQFLVRFACDLVRCLPNDFAIFKIDSFGTQAVHFMLAEGLVNQVGGDPTMEQMVETFDRITAAPSEWHRDVQVLYDNVSKAVALWYQTNSKLTGGDSGIYPEYFSGSAATVILKRAKEELKALRRDAALTVGGTGESSREAQLLLFGLLDLLSQLVATFPVSEGITGVAEQLALNIITTSNLRELRFKAFEVIIASKTGCSETEFFNSMRELETYIIGLASAEHDGKPKTEAETQATLQRVQELRKEKRAAMDKYEKKMMWYRGAIESLHRRLQPKRRPGEESRNDNEQLLSPSSSWDVARSVAVSPVPSGSVFGQGYTCESPISQPVPPFGYTPVTPTGSAMSSTDTHQPGTVAGSQTFDHENTISAESTQDKVDTAQEPEDDSPIKFRPFSFQKDAEEVLHVRKLRQQESEVLVEEDAPMQELELGESGAPIQRRTTLERIEEAEEECSTTTDDYHLERVAEPKDGLPASVDSAADVEKGTGPCLSAKSDDIAVLQGAGVSDGLGAVPSGAENEGWVIVENGQTSRKPNAPLINVGNGKVEKQSEYVEKIPGSSTEVNIRQGIPVTNGCDGVLADEGDDVDARSRSKMLSPQPCDEKIPVADDMVPGSENGKRAYQNVGLERELIQRNSLPTPGNRSTTYSLELPLQGTNDEDFFLPIQNPDDYRSSTSQIDQPQTPAELEQQEAVAMESSDYKFTPKPSRASRLFSRLGSLRSSSPRSRSRSPQQDRPRLPTRADEGPEVIQNPQQFALLRSQTSPEMYNEKMELLRRHTNAAYSQSATVASSSLSSTLVTVTPESHITPTKPDYESIASEHVCKLTPKENIAVFLTGDCRFVIYMSSQAFQVYSVPSSTESAPLKPRFSYRLGEVEGIKKSKVPWEYKGGAASPRYIATLTSCRVQIHDLQKACQPVFVKETKGNEYHSIVIAANKMAIGMKPIGGVDGSGAISIYRMNNDSSTQGPKWEEWKNIHLLIPQVGTTVCEGTPNLLSFTRDGKFLTACTQSGYFFAWDISNDEEPLLISSGVIGSPEGPGAEALTGAFLFPDARHILCSTVSLSPVEMGWGGCFTEPTRSPLQPPSHHPIRQVGLKIHHAAISPDGNSIAFLGRTGQINIVPLLRIEGDDNVTTTAAIPAQQRLQPSLIAATAGRVMFTPEGDRLVAVDRKGKVVILSFRKF